MVGYIEGQRKTAKSVSLTGIKEFMSGTFTERLIQVIIIDVIQLDQTVHSKLNTIERTGFRNVKLIWSRKLSNRIVVPTIVNFLQISLLGIYYLVQKSMTTSVQTVV
jgi:hypothetical protein